MTMTATPCFTIITSTWNAAATLPRLLDSLAAQTCRDFNWIVQDGASSDATLDIVEQYRDRLPEILTAGGRDDGIYDAWNKAIDRWQDKLGEWILFLGADDALAGPDVLAAVKEHLTGCPETVLYAIGGMTFTDYEQGTSRSADHPADYAEKFRQRFSGMPLSHSALFQRRRVFFPERFDAAFRICGDYDFILRTWTATQQLYRLPVLVTIMAAGGISSSPRMKRLYLQEKRRAICKNLSFDKKAPCRYFVLLADAYAFPAKIALKNALQRFSAGKHLWQLLHKLHKRLAG